MTRAVVVGAPPKWVWHQLDSGISRQVDILVLGEREARRARWAVATVRAARSNWASLDLRARVWRELYGEDPPPPPIEAPYAPPDPIMVAGPDLVHEPDPFSPLGALLREDRPLHLGEERDAQLAVEGPDGQWQAMVDAVEIETDQGYLVLPAQREVDVLVEEDEASYTAASLRPGMRIAIGRHSGRIGLLEALEDKLGHRPDLLAGRLLVHDYRSRVYKQYAASRLTVQELHRRLVALGCSKVPATVAGWVHPGGPMAPRETSQTSGGSMLLWGWASLRDGSPRSSPPSPGSGRFVVRLAGPSRRLPEKRYGQKTRVASTLRRASP